MDFLFFGVGSRQEGTGRRNSCWLTSLKDRQSCTMRTLGALLSLLLIAHTEGSGHSWTYPEETEGDGAAWSSQYPTCAGKEQSPINIQTSQVSENKALRPLKLSGYGLQEGEFQLINNGHSAQLSLPSSMQIIGGMSHVYTAVQLHFHWGGKTAKFHGSEHRINGVQYDSELHILHYNSEQYNSSNEAQGQTNGLAVVSVLIKAKEDQENVHYEKLFSYLPKISNVGDNVTLSSIEIQHLLPHDYSRYYRYNGSLTTPPCSENVTWTVLAEPVIISKAQLDELQNLLLNSNHQSLQNNFRKVKPLNNRRVEANFSPKEEKGKESQSQSKPKHKNKAAKRHSDH
ncbi:carbonic anhydrase 6 isoform X2 [Petaurus breviceps papuanus]|uniref:carbonic anhydrase 6 isoform X2 n=1 Tax=Petaurus breviceps papuanus TaxID=3040969 RepID=UPI0036DE2F15